MTGQDAEILERLSGERAESAAIDDLQGLLLQISLAIMMIFMMSYFMFRMKTDRDVKENLLELNRQKLILAADKVEKQYRERYGLEALTRINEEGERVFDAHSVAPGDALTEVRHLRGAFAVGSAAAAIDYRDAKANLANWRSRTLAESGVREEELSEQDGAWLEKRCAEAAETLRRDMRLIQRACAVNIQKAWLEEPGKIGDKALREMLERLEKAGDAERPALAAEISEALKARSVDRLGELCGAEMLP